MDEKKKMMVVAALFVVVIGVGAFQFMSGSADTQAKPKGKAAGKTVADDPGSATGADDKVSAELANPQYAASLPVRDPFQVGTITSTVEPEPTQPTVPRTFPRSSGGMVPPLNPLGGQPGGIPAPFGNGGIGLQGAAAIRPPGQFPMVVTGVVMGERPSAVFQDDQGNQVLVGLGGEVGPESRVTGIARDKVIVRHKGKTVTLTVGANSNGN